MQAAIQSPTNPLLPPAANRLWISDGWNNALGSAPNFTYKLQAVSVVAENEVVVDLKYDNVNMTDDQWHNWSVDDNDEEYIIACISANLGLTLA